VDLVVEILSPSSARKDRLLKLVVFEDAGISQDWIADPQARTLDRYRLLDVGYVIDDSETAVVAGVEIPSETLTAWETPAT